jgi:AcrR family transcriptional regulator
MATTATSRQERRKANTRAKLVDATRRVVADQGVEATTIALVTESADVGFGTFYLHFDSKEAAIEAVMAELVEEVGTALDHLTAPMQDPAEVLAVSVRHVVGQVDRDEVWAWAVLRIGVSHRLFTSALGGRLVRDLQRGVDAGRFDPALHPVAPFAIGGVVEAAMRARLNGLVDADTPQAVAEQVLRMLGVKRREAKRIAALPLPALPDD